MTFYTPSHEQIEDSDKMLEYEHALLWNDAGTGKTVTTMEAFRKGDYDKLVVVAPKIALTMWQEELEKHLGIRALTLRTGRIPPKKLNVHGADALITTPALAGKHLPLFRDFMRGGSQSSEALSGVLVLDEAHAYKNPTAKRTKEMFGPMCGLTPDSVGYYFNDIWELTGTPIMRYPDDLWSQLRPIRPATLRYFGVLRYTEFVNKFCITDTRQYGHGRPMRVVTGAKNQTELKRLLDACKVTRRTLEECVHNLPPLTHSPVEIDYKGVDNFELTPERMKELLNSDSPTARTWKLLGLAKVKGIVDFLLTQEQQPTLIGYWHRDVGAEYVVKLLSADRKVVELNGSTSLKERDSIQKRFNNGELDYVVAQMEAAQVSLNLQEACSRVVITEELPSPTALHQFYSRVYRRGQKRHVHVFHCRTLHGLDSGLHQLRNRKDKINEGLGV